MNRLSRPLQTAGGQAATALLFLAVSAACASAARGAEAVPLAVGAWGETPPRRIEAADEPGALNARSFFEPPTAGASTRPFSEAPAAVAVKPWPSEAVVPDAPTAKAEADATMAADSALPERAPALPESPVSPVLPAPPATPALPATPAMPALSTPSPSASSTPTPTTTMPPTPTPTPTPMASPPAAVSSVVDPGRWLRHPVRFDLDREALAAFLQAFAHQQRVPARVSAALAARGRVSGRFVFQDPAELLDIVAETQRVDWYFDGTSVHFFSADELATRMYPLAGRSVDTLRRTLEELGLFDARRPWTVADEGRLLLVRGPEVYVEHVGSALQRQREAADVAAREKTLGVFRLKHAWASERALAVGGVSTTVPGVADLLKRNVTGEAVPPENVAAEKPRLMRADGLLHRRAAAAGASLADAAPAGAPANDAAGTDASGAGLSADSVGPAAPGPDSLAGAFIQADARLNAVLVWDYAANMPLHRRIIDGLDQPLALVEIRAAILDVQADRIRDLGISWSGAKSDGKWQHQGGQNLGSGDERVDFKNLTGDGFQYATIFTKGLDQFMLRVNALEQTGNANVLSRPSVLTQDNHQASLEHTETFYVKLQGEREVDLADISTGLTLRVTPHVVGDGANPGIQLAVHIADGTDAGDTDERVDGLPRVRQSAITTQAIINEGEALVIGGYYTETRSVSRTGVPVLKNIPGLGALFRNRRQDNLKSERLFVLAPRVIRPDEGHIVPGSEGERTFSESPGREILKGPAANDKTNDGKRKRLLGE